MTDEMPFEDWAEFEPSLESMSHRRSDSSAVKEEK
jgi:hypothetical protein